MVAPGDSQSALVAQAIESYRALLFRAAAVAPAEVKYIDILGYTWLASMIRRLPGHGLQALGLLTDDEIRVFDHLQATVADPDATPDALLEWVDAYPEAIVNLIDQRNDE